MICASGYIAVEMQEHGAWNASNTHEKLEEYVHAIGWEKEYNQTVSTVIDYFNKGLAYKSNSTMVDSKFEELQHKEWAKVLPFGTRKKGDIDYTSRSVYEMPQNVISYNVPMHGWIVMGAGDSMKDAKPKDLPADMRYHYIEKTQVKNCNDCYSGKRTVTWASAFLIQTNNAPNAKFEEGRK